MPRGHQHPGSSRTLADLYAQSPGASAVAQESSRLGLGEVRLAGSSPYLTLVVQAPAGPLLDALAAYASVAMELTVFVTGLETYPEWRRSRIWEASVPLRLDAPDLPDG